MSGRAAKTADGVEVKPGDTVWHMAADQIGIDPDDYEAREFGEYLLGCECWSTRLAALVAARDRAAAEVERLTAEIEKEKANGA